MSLSNGNLGSVQMNPSNIQTASASPQPSPLNLPCQDLLDEGRKQEYLEICFPLYKASMRGDWKAAKYILHNREELVRFSINRNNETMLHVAVYRGHTSFVNKLVVLMNNMDLELKNSSSNTALCIAATAGHVAVAKIMVTKHDALLDIVGSQGMMPLHMAALSGKHDMVKYLYEKSQRMTRGIWTDESRCSVLLACVEVQLFDVAIQIVNDRPELAVSGGHSLLQVLARNPQLSIRKKPTFIQKILFYPKRNLGLEEPDPQALQLVKIIWEIIEKLPTTEIDGILRGPADLTTSGLATMPKYSSRLLFVAAEKDNAEFIIELIRNYPERVLELNDNKQTIFHIAVLYRHANVYSLLYEMSSIMESIINIEDINGNSMLHLVGIIEETTMFKHYEDMSLLYVQMENELQWFKIVEDALPPSLRVKKNTAGLSPLELFIKNHKDLVSKGQEWMKKTCSELLLLAALMISISFAAAISFASGDTTCHKGETNPDTTSHKGETNPDTSPDTRELKVIYVEFMVYNAISFLCASFSIMCILSIIGSRYVEQDFMESLPRSLITVIRALWASMIFMITAFLCIISLLNFQDNPWILTPMIIAFYVGVIIYGHMLLPSMFAHIGLASSIERFSLRNKETMYQEIRSSVP